MASWLANQTFPPLLPLPEYGQLNLLSDLGLTQYLKDNQCTEMDEIYEYQSNGWTKSRQKL